jgi:hypothetical protein
LVHFSALGFALWRSGTAGGFQLPSEEDEIYDPITAPTVLSKKPVLKSAFPFCKEQMIRLLRVGTSYPSLAAQYTKMRLNSAPAAYVAQPATKAPSAKDNPAANVANPIPTPIATTVMKEEFTGTPGENPLKQLRQQARAKREEH